MVPAYIDPGTGSMLFAIIIGIVGAINYALRMFLVKLRFLFSGGKDVEANEEKIPLAIFSDNKRYWNVLKPICDELDKRGIDVTYLTASEDDPALSYDLPHMKAVFLGEGNKAFAKLNLINATIVLSTTPGLDVYQWKRSKQAHYYVHVLHAAGEVVLYRMFGLDYYDAVLIAGEFQAKDIRALEGLRGLPAKELYYGGIPYMDDMVRRLKESGPVEPHPRTVLLAPSWGPSAIFTKFGGKIIEELLATGYHVIVRPHPQSFTSETDMIEKIMADFPESDQLEWNRDVDNFECLRRSDILVSDFSGVVFDFALVYDKPVIYADTHFDTAPYDAWWLDKEIWTHSALRRIGMQLGEGQMGNIKQMIDTCIDDPRFAEGRSQVRSEAWQYYGQGTQRTVDYLENKLAELSAGEATEAAAVQQEGGK